MTTLHHRLRRMTGRDPEESHRTATPLELLFDLSFVVAFGVAGNQLAHELALGHIGPALGAFAFVIFATCWAWINFAWFASAYDTDDWFYRITTMVQMIGVIILALGIPDVFHSMVAGDHLDNGVVVAGYVVMRVAMLAQWLRVAREDPLRRRTALTYVVFIAIAQLGWIYLAIAELPISAVFLWAPVLYTIEVGGPIFAERRIGGTPWHAHHIAERYGLLTIIALGEGVFGTVAAVSAVVERQSWSTDAVLIVVAGIGLTFGLWWNYFILPSGEVLAKYRERGFVWGYGHIFLFGAIAATGAGLHVAAYVIEDESVIGTTGAVLATAIPVAVFAITLFSLYGFLVKEFDPFHVLLFLGAIAVLATAVVLAALGVGIGWCLVVLTLSPVVTVVGYETIGHQHEAAVLERLLGADADATP